MIFYTLQNLQKYITKYPNEKVNQQILSKISPCFEIILNSTHSHARYTILVLLNSILNQNHDWINTTCEEKLNMFSLIQNISHCFFLILEARTKIENSTQLYDHIRQLELLNQIGFSFFFSSLFFSFKKIK